jgi:CheY-like chemotaxis protein
MRVAPFAEHGWGRILVMDDDEPLRDLLVRALTGLGYDVESAGDGAEALALYPTGRFDAVLLDLTVAGGMGGAEAAARLRALDPKVKLIVSSGYSDAPVMADFRRYGFDAVIRKPWTLEQLADVVQNVVGKSTGASQHRAGIGESASSFTGLLPSTPG